MSKLKETLRRLAGARPANDDVFEELIGLAVGEIEGAEHRALAVVGAANLEEALRGAIAKHLFPTRTEDTQLFDDEHAPLQGLAARVRIAFSLGIIDDTVRSDITYIRLIRIAFAHSPQRLSFGHATILASLNSLHSLQTLEAIPSATDDMQTLSKDNVNAIRYASAVSTICGALRLHVPFWTPNRGLARVLTVASFDKPAPPHPEAQENPSGSR